MHARTHTTDTSFGRRHWLCREPHACTHARTPRTHRLVVGIGFAESHTHARTHAHHGHIVSSSALALQRATRMHARTHTTDTSFGRRHWLCREPHARTHARTPRTHRLVVGIGFAESRTHARTHAHHGHIVWSSALALQRATRTHARTHTTDTSSRCCQALRVGEKSAQARARGRDGEGALTEIFVKVLIGNLGWWWEFGCGARTRTQKKRL
jgi:hypothetical protein